MNPDYILREQGAVLNWFDIVEVDGRFSLNDKIGDIMKTFRGKLWFVGLFLTLAKKMSQGTPKSEGKKTKKKKNPERQWNDWNLSVRKSRKNPVIWTSIKKPLIRLKSNL